MSGVEAWTALHRAGLVPATWMDGRARLFDPVGDDNLRVAESGQPAPGPAASPPTPAACVALASCDPTVVETAERAALRLFGAVDVWRKPNDREHVAPPSLCVWELLPIGGAVRARKIQMVQGLAATALEAASLAVEEHSRGLFQQTSVAIRHDDERIAAAVERSTGLRVAGAGQLRWWALARELDLVVPRELRRDHRLGVLPKTVRGKRFVELPDLAPALETVALAGFAAGLHGATCTMFAVRPQWAALAAVCGAPETST